MILRGLLFLTCSCPLQLLSVVAAGELTLDAYLTPPKTVLAMKDTLGLSKEQVLSIRKLDEMFVSLNSPESELLQIVKNEERQFTSLLAGNDVNPEEIIQQAERLMQIEKQVKLARLRVLIRVRRELTAGQRKALIAQHQETAATRDRLEKLIDAVRKQAGHLVNTGHAVEKYVAEQVKRVRQLIAVQRFEDAEKELHKILEDLKGLASDKNPAGDD